MDVYTLLAKYFNNAFRYLSIISQFTTQREKPTHKDCRKVSTWNYLNIFRYLPTVIKYYPMTIIHFYTCVLFLHHSWHRKADVDSLGRLSFTKRFSRAFSHQSNLLLSKAESSLRIRKYQWAELSTISENRLCAFSFRRHKEISSYIY